jgi:low affinity Fe/Cu permease
VKRTEAAESRQHEDARNRFERFVAAVNHRVSRGPFFVLIVLAVVGWGASYPLWDNHTKWESSLHTGSAILSLFLLVLLENAGRRSEEAAQEKLNVLAEALSDLMESRAREDDDLTDAVRRLRESVGLEERH